MLIMKVNELIEHLKKFPQDAEVHFPRTTTAGTIKNIRMGKQWSTEGKVCFFTGYDWYAEEVEYPNDN